MAFKKIATLDIRSVYATDNNGKFQWRDFVKQANENPSNDRTKFLPQEAYNYDTKNFLFLTARAISGMEKHGYNGNFDAFPWEEIKKALPTYPGVGFYIEHKEDSEADAKGIVLDAVPNDEEEYVVCLCAIDKNEYPEFCQQILDGTYNQVSMSCLASTCECSKCHNVATSFDNLCEHMNPNNPITYMKGRVDENGDTVYEINRDLCFTGLSAVEVPADKDAFVFDIKASKDKQSKLKEEFAKYTKLKQAGKMKEFKMACEEQFKALSNVDLLNKMKILADSLLTTIMGVDNTQVITTPLQGIVRELMQLQIGLNIMDLQKLDNTTPVKEEGGQEPLTMIEDEAENFGEKQEEVNLNKEIESMLKNCSKNKEEMKSLHAHDAYQLLKNKTITREDGELFNKIVNRAIKNGFNAYLLLKDKIITREDSDLRNKAVNQAINDGYVFHLLAENIIIDIVDTELYEKLINTAIKLNQAYPLLEYGLVTKEDKLFNKLINDVIKRGNINQIKGLIENNIITQEELDNITNNQSKIQEQQEVSLDKEIDSYLDGDNYSYTPFSSTAKIKKKAGTWAIPDTEEKVHKLKDILKEPLPASKAHDKISDLIGDDELYDEIDDYLEVEPSEAVNNVIKYHLKRIKKCPLNHKSYNTEEKYKEAEEAKKLWDIILKDY